jgi:hypothetical protein
MEWIKNNVVDDEKLRFQTKTDDQNDRSEPQTTTAPQPIEDEGQ